MADQAIHLQDVRFAYSGSERPLLHDLSLRVESGEFVAVVGPSGVGKSTLLNLVAGLAVPRSGRVDVLGTDVATLEESAAARWRRRHLGFVFQQFHLLPHLTVAENAALPLALNGEAWTDDEVTAFLDRLGLGEHAGAYPRHLSGGQAQRAAIARALIHRPPILLADELTGNLDEETAEAMLDLLTEVVAEAGATTLVVTHAPEVAARAHTRYRLTHHNLHPEP
ncbi:ABC transporter ATP-binding protein [Thiohalorhabdus sp.]|uniref:ABC transporter ATP-binding protein n=1 Tax=Thiohalorhabdus sp. TaxID=3094134 RepID=UPI002FC2839A